MAAETRMSPSSSRRAQPSTCRRARRSVALASLLGLLTLQPPLAPAAEPEGETAVVQADVKNSAAAPDQPAHRTRPRVRLTEQQRVELEALRLAQALGLDAAQQARVKALLVDEHRELHQATVGDPQTQADRVGQVRAIVDRTREQIRSMLSDEQRKKYPGVTPTDLLGPTHTDLDYWTRATQQEPVSPSGSATP